MKVFVSFSGHRSQLIAEALRGWLPDVIQGLEPWMSQRDIEAGARWPEELIKQLDGTQFGILCLTPENLGAAWILFEAGALSKTKSVTRSRVCPYLFQVSKSEITWPLAQFQANLADEKGTLSVVRSLNVACGASRLSESQLKRQFQRCWDELDRRLKAVPSQGDQQPSKRTEEDVLHELLELVRDLSRSVAARSKQDLLAKLLDAKQTRPPLAREAWVGLQKQLTDLLLEMYSESSVDDPDADTVKKGDSAGKSPN